MNCMFIIRGGNMTKFILLYDCPMKNCDKIWLYEELKKWNGIYLPDIYDNEQE